MLARRFGFRSPILKCYIFTQNVRRVSSASATNRPRSRHPDLRPKGSSSRSTPELTPKTKLLKHSYQEKGDEEPDSYEGNPFSPSSSTSPFINSPLRSNRTNAHSSTKEVHNELLASHGRALRDPTFTMPADNIQENDLDIFKLDLKSPLQKVDLVQEDIVESLRVQAAAITLLVNKPSFLDVPGTTDEILLKAWFMLYHLSALVGRDYQDDADGQADLENFLTSQDPDPVSEITTHRILALKLAHCAAHLVSHFDVDSDIWWSELPAQVFGHDAVTRMGIVGAPPLGQNDLPSITSPETIPPLPASSSRTSQATHLSLDFGHHISHPKEMAIASPQIDPADATIDLKKEIEDHQRTLDVTAVAARLFAEKWKRWTEVLIFQSRRLPELQEMIDDPKVKLDEEEKESTELVKAQLLKAFERKWRNPGHGAKELLADALELAALLEASGWGQKEWEEAVKVGLVQPNKPPELEEIEKRKAEEIELKAQTERSRQSAVSWHGISL